MTKPTPPRLATSEVVEVEIDAMDVMEWQHGQRTPQASDANLAALVKQSAKAHESAPVSAEAPRTPPLVARPRSTEAPPSRPGATRAPEPKAAGSSVRPATAAGAPGPNAKRAEGSTPLPPVAVPRPPTVPASAARAPTVPASTAPPEPRARQVTETPMVPVPAVRPQRADAGFPVIRTPPPTEAEPPALPMSVGGYPIYRGPALNEDTPAPVRYTPTPELRSAPVGPAPSAQQPIPLVQAPVAPSGLPALYVPDRSDTPPVPAPVVRPPHLERPPSQDPLAISDLSPASTEVRKLREGVRPKQGRMWLLAGAGGIAAAVLGVAIAVATEGPAPEAPAPARAPVAAATSEPAAPAAAVPAAAAAPATAQVAETKPSVPSVVAHAPAHPAAAPSPAPAATPHGPAPARVAAAIPPSRPAPARASHPARRPRKIVVDYQTRRDETPVPGLVAQASEDPAIARARSAYLSGNDKLFAGDPSGAAAAYREALALYPGYVGGYRGLGLAYAQLGNTAKAIESLKSYVAAAPGAKDVELIKKRIARLQSK